MYMKGKKKYLEEKENGYSRFISEEIVKVPYVIIRLFSVISRTLMGGSDPSAAPANWAIYIYVYCHPQTDCFVLSELFSVAKHVGRSKPGSKPIQLYVRLSLRPPGQQVYHVWLWELLRYLCSNNCSRLLLPWPCRVELSSERSKRFATSVMQGSSYESSSW